ncbi:MAG: type I methionyl aminopeptidase [Spirochaetales bacterium]|jgi:methionyl aminopeptidase|nr:type I methionyl aminopeptidase [Spirochaetales bacterium]
MMDSLRSQTRNIYLKTGVEMQRIRKPSRILESLFRDLQSKIVPGVTTNAINAYCERFILEKNAQTALKGYKGFPAAICASPNDVAVHGIPTSAPLFSGDIITIDITISIDGWHADSAWTYFVGAVDDEKKRLVKAAWKATVSGILAAKAGGRFGDIGAAVERTAKRFGCSVLEDFAGHGIGRMLHEDPIVVNVGTRGVGQPIVPGMVFTVEPILCIGRPEVRTLDDGWTVVTLDGSPTAQFEHTIAIFRDRTEIMTYTVPGVRTNIDALPYL